MKYVRIIPAIPKENKKIKVIAYCRVSTSGPEQLRSLEVQIKTYMKMIRSHSNWIFAGVFFDVESGLRRSGRTGLDKMLRKENLIPPELTQYQISITYANDADVLNVALFGITTKQWRERNPDKNGNIRDYATLNQLLVLANMESYNAILIEQARSQAERLQLLNQLAIRQLKAIEEIGTNVIRKLENKE